MFIFIKLIILSSIFLSTGLYAHELDVASSAKACMSVIASNDVWDFPANRLDLENVVVEHTKLTPVSESEIKKYLKLEEDRNITMNALAGCLDRRHYEISKSMPKINEGWNKGVKKHDFAKNRTLVNSKILDRSDVLSALNILVDANCKKGTCLGRIKDIYLSKSERKMVESYESKCEIRTHKNRDTCIDEVRKIAKKLYPNFVHAAHLRSELNKFLDAKYPESEYCGSEQVAFSKINKEQSQHSPKVEKVLKSLGFDANVGSIGETEAMHALIDNEAYIVKYSYQPTKAKVEKINDEIQNPFDETSEANAKLLRLAMKTSKETFLYYPGDEGYIISRFAPRFMGGSNTTCSKKELEKASKYQTNSKATK